MDNMMDMMERYANNLEQLVEERTSQLAEEQSKTEALLHRMLPRWDFQKHLKFELYAVRKRWQNFLIFETAFFNFKQKLFMKVLRNIICKQKSIF